MFIIKWILKFIFKIVMLIAVLVGLVWLLFNWPVKTKNEDMKFGVSLLIIMPNHWNWIGKKLTQRF